MSTATQSNPIEVKPPRSRAFDWTALWSLYVLSLRQHRHGKRWMVMAALMLLPAGLVALVRTTARDVPSEGLEFIFVFMLIPQALLPLVALMYGSGMVQDEVEEQTITYLLIRPISEMATLSRETGGDVECRRRADDRFHSSDICDDLRWRERRNGTCAKALSPRRRRFIRWR